MNTEELASNILKDIQFAIDAHINNPKIEDDKVRFWDRKTPYIIHPTWCAMTILTETSLDASLRLNGYKALLWHDVLEDTHLKLPDDAPQEIVRYIEQMTFNRFSDEVEEIWNRDKEIRLFKLYDKVSNLLDGTWMKDDKWNRYVEFTQKLADDVKANYGELNIFKISSVISIKKA